MPAETGRRLIAGGLYRSVWSGRDDRCFPVIHETCQLGRSGTGREFEPAGRNCVRRARRAAADTVPAGAAGTSFARAPADMAAAPSRLAYHDGDFVDSDDARPLRILAEYLEPLRRFRQQRIQDTVVFFGSARITPKVRSAATTTRRARSRAG